MAYAEAHNSEVLAHYEGLIFATARMLRDHVEQEPEDVQQILRIKCFRALLAFQPGRKSGTAGPCLLVASCRCQRCRYVFMCVRDQAKDLAKRRHRGELHIEELVAADSNLGLESRDWFDGRFLATTHDEVYGQVEDGGVQLPNTLTSQERKIVMMLYCEHRQTEVARALHLGKRDMEKSMRSLRVKLADWRPEPLPPPVPLPLDRPEPAPIAA